MVLATSASPVNWLEMQILSTSEAEALGVEPGNVCFNNLQQIQM